MKGDKVRWNTTHPMNAKRFLPLALLYAAENERIEGRTRFQKLAFLAEQQLDDEGIGPYDFVAYDYGPFSKELLNELDALEEEGLVIVNELRTFGGDERYDYWLTSDGSDSYEQSRPDREADLSTGERNFAVIDQTAGEIVDEFGDMPISNLIGYVYDEYPKYAENSVLY